ncbi:GMC oxidoreductase [Periconia macrospinosa]|uniref:GMC oxidoreductase n=1 Tax=Periconia macrospinosa TaxID=97972 RepID=A0A2V1E0J5_9PLEO|nr:GMC oxidoreductase [Periconia macrospinosa]
MKLLQLLPLSLAATTLSAASPARPESLPRSSGSPGNGSNTYDYIVTGSGPGGGTIATNLARAGHSVLLIEAGSDQSENIATQVLAFVGRGGAAVTWGFFVKHTDDIERTKRYNLLVWRLSTGGYWVGKFPGPPHDPNAEMMGVYYPRGATLGGSAITNAGAFFLPADSDWDVFNKGSEEVVWSAKDIRRILTKIEKNNYLPNGTEGHGFKGWLETNTGDRNVYPATSLRLPIMRAMAKLLGLEPSKIVDYVTSDGNFEGPNRDQQTGMWALPFHVNKGWRRYSPRDRILETLGSKNADGTPKFPLTLQLNSLTTKVLFEPGETPKAIGVEYMTGASLYRADPRWNTTINSTLHRAYARNEVIVSGGTFNTPQILQLSGIGPKSLLEKHNIPLISDLPGVGRNLQDNYELPVVARAQINITVPNNCTFGQLGDPCLALWRLGQGPYAQAGNNGFGALYKTQKAIDNERDIFFFNSPGVLRGFTPGGANLTYPPTPDPPSTFGWQMVKMHPQNGQGVVQIKSNDPTDTPDINFHHFTNGADTDIPALMEAIALARKSMKTTAAPVGPVTAIEPPCPAADVDDEGVCKDPEIDRKWLEDQVFGHHPVGTSKVGGDDDEMAVLDQRLRVRGVKGLRVVDASAFPRNPGAFPAAATFLLGAKASELVLEDAGKL